jgi:hypothetical protein
MLTNNSTEGNVSDSLLLRLPAEVRKLIFEYALGGQHVHVEQLHVGTANRYEKKDIRFGQGLWNELCYASDGEAGAYVKFRNAQMGQDAEATPFGKTKDGEDVGQGYHVDSWSARHLQCGHAPDLNRFHVTLEEWKQRPCLSLSSLRTCKIIFKEMRTLPYSGNVFCFRNPFAFQAFAATVRKEQLHAVLHLNLLIAVGSAPFSGGRATLWASILWNYQVTRCIRNIVTFDITVELYFPRDEFSARPRSKKPLLDDCVPEVNVSSPEEVNLSTNWIKQFARLSKKVPRFRVVVCDDPLSMWGQYDFRTAMRDWRIRDVRVWMRERNQKCLTVEQKQILAKELEDGLLADARDARTMESSQ